MKRHLHAVGCTACLALFSACEHNPGAAALPVVPSPAAHTTAAAARVHAPADDVRRASALLAENVTGWELPQAPSILPGQPSRTNAAALAATSSPADLAAAVAALNGALRSAHAPARQGPPE